MVQSAQREEWLSTNQPLFCWVTEGEDTSTYERFDSLIPMGVSFTGGTELESSVFPLIPTLFHLAFLPRSADYWAQCSRNNTHPSHAYESFDGTNFHYNEYPLENEQKAVQKEICLGLCLQRSEPWKSVWYSTKTTKKGTWVNSLHATPTPY